MSGRFWLGAYCEGTPDARYDDDWVRLGVYGDTLTTSVDAEFGDGRVWLGEYHDSWTMDPIARYTDGYIWLGPYEGSKSGADARYGGGHIWLGSHDEGRPVACYDGDDDGAVAAAVLLLLDFKSANIGSETDDSSDNEQSGSYEASSQYSYPSSSPPDPGILWFALIVVGILFGIGGLVCIMERRDQENRGPVYPTSAPIIENGYARPRGYFFTIGATMDQVNRIQGWPDESVDQKIIHPEIPDFIVCRYGSSYVSFLSGRVAGWTRSGGENPNNLKARVFASGPVNKDLLYFKAGSTKAEVLFVQGQPDSVHTENFDQWDYGSSFVRFQNGRVSSWENPQGGPLKLDPFTALESLPILPMWKLVEPATQNFPWK